MTQLAGSVLIVLTAILATACPVVYGGYHRWWRSPPGRLLFTFMAVLALVIDLWALRLVIPDGTWFVKIRLIAFAGMPVVLGRLLVVIVKAVLAEKRERKEGGG